MKSIRKAKKEYKKELKAYFDLNPFNSVIPKDILNKLYLFKK